MNVNPYKLKVFCENLMGLENLAKNEFNLKDDVEA